MDFFTPECSSSSTNTAKERKEDECGSSPLTHLFVELTSLEELSFPTSSSTRIKVWYSQTNFLIGNIWWNKVMQYLRYSVLLNIENQASLYISFYCEIYTRECRKGYTEELNHRYTQEFVESNRRIFIYELILIPLIFLLSCDFNLLNVILLLLLILLLAGINKFLMFSSGQTWSKFRMLSELGCLHFQFTCLDASAHYLAVGSTSGTVYLFSRFASKYRNRISSVPIQVISIKDGSIIKVIVLKYFLFFLSLILFHTANFLWLSFYPNFTLSFRFSFAYKNLENLFCQFPSRHVSIDFHKNPILSKLLV